MFAQNTGNTKGCVCFENCCAKGFSPELIKKIVADTIKNKIINSYGLQPVEKGRKFYVFGRKFVKICLQVKCSHEQIS